MGSFLLRLGARIFLSGKDRLTALTCVEIDNVEQIL